MQDTNLDSNVRLNASFHEFWRILSFKIERFLGVIQTNGKKIFCNASHVTNEKLQLLFL